ncbi:hypothetical protein [Magnetospirillum sp. 64-120]|uniref:hypothetical protein n=1 Tax=Magnetospirillum sp. 64-120 TaxID=1895778 RepID=UPI000929464A|nr:hypothetical protein [Magnetospirillum sp. 64-120]OJX79971.1 MAG: hypothetical protein BGO92_03420 [Magnetospirillum sp. 64-120]
MNETIELVLFVYGLGAVIALGAAVLIKLIVAVLAWADRPDAQPQAVASSVSSAVAEGIPAHHLVAIAAAAHATLGAHRIVHIGPARSGAGWSAEGRFAQHGSHNISHHH